MVVRLPLPLWSSTAVCMNRRSSCTFPFICSDQNLKELKFRVAPQQIHIFLHWFSSNLVEVFETCHNLVKCWYFLPLMFYSCGCSALHLCCSALSWCVIAWGATGTSETPPLADTQPQIPASVKSQLLLHCHCDLCSRNRCSCLFHARLQQSKPQTPTDFHNVHLHSPHLSQYSTLSSSSCVSRYIRTPPNPSSMLRIVLSNHRLVGSWCLSEARSCNNSSAHTLVTRSKLEAKSTKIFFKKNRPDHECVTVSHTCVDGAQQVCTFRRHLSVTFEETWGLVFLRGYLLYNADTRTCSLARERVCTSSSPKICCHSWAEQGSRNVCHWPLWRTHTRVHTQRDEDEAVMP